jgi:hypothetical protein
MISLARLALILIPLYPHYREVQVRHWHVQHWALEAKTDRFTGKTWCHLERGPMSYLRQALVFHFPVRVDTSDATYRVDAGTPQSAKSDAVALAKLGFSLYAEDLDNPSGGIVRIPMTKLLSARSVLIQIRAGRYPTPFTIAGFSAALDSARTAGCTDPYYY